jgi:hypothetical protein
VSTGVPRIFDSVVTTCGGVTGKDKMKDTGTRPGKEDMKNTMMEKRP